MDYRHGKTLSKIIEQPKEPIKLDQCTTITDVTLFINSHLDIVKAQKGNTTCELYLDRLKKLKLLLGMNQRRVTFE